jgi:hypothetical protein
LAWSTHWLHADAAALKRVANGEKVGGELVITGGDTAEVSPWIVRQSAIAEFEWIEEEKAYREWLIPARFINKHATESGDLGMSDNKATASQYHKVHRTNQRRECKCVIDCTTVSR